MNSTNPKRRNVWAVMVVLLLTAISASPFAPAKKSKEKQASMVIDSWLVAGPAHLAETAFGGLTVKERTGRILKGEVISPEKLWPSAGDKLAWLPSSTFEWKKVSAEKGWITPGSPGSNTSVSCAACYVRAERWMKVNVKLEAAGPIALFLDGEQKIERKTREKGRKAKPLSAELILRTGLHRLFLVTLCPPEAKRWRFRATIEAEKHDVPLPTASLSSLHPITLRDVYSTEYVARVILSGNGRMLCAGVRTVDLKNDKWGSFLRILDTKTGSTIMDLKSFPEASAPYFSPNGRYLAFQAPDPANKKKRVLWLLDLKSRTVEKLLTRRGGVRDIRWSPDEEFIYFIATAPRKRPKTPPPFERFTQMYQRWTGWENRDQIFVFSLETKSLHQLTSGPDTVQDMALSSNGKTLAIERIVHTTERPYLTTEIWTCDTSGGSSKRLLSLRRWPDTSELCFSPDGKKIAFISSPTDMVPGGSPKERVAYDFDLFVLDTATRKLKNLTEDFKPSVGSQLIGAYPGRRNLWWSPHNNLIYFIGTDKSTLKLYKTNAAGDSLQVLHLPDTALGGPDMSSSGTAFAYVGSSFDSRPAIKFLDLTHTKIRTLAEPGKKVYDRCTTTVHEDFTFKNKRGVSIEGWIFLPDNFDAHKKYPLVVAYYGGVVPYGQAFRPELFDLAGRGYVVYLLNPEGAVGYGPKFADVHMNDWGKKAGEDIIEGVQKLLNAKPFIDAKHIGCYGGSYGGFMTLYIIGHSDLFAAAVDMYGISDITSYWGAGWWGFNYGDTALANSYPWTRKDIFVNRSPVYFANRIKTPLLILHGDADINVPPDEADQIFTAMRVLGRKCEYVSFAGEGHGLHKKPSNALASDDMLFEWFDRYLKDQPDAWKYRWKDQPAAIAPKKK